MLIRPLAFRKLLDSRRLGPSLWRQDIRPVLPEGMLRLGKRKQFDCRRSADDYRPEASMQHPSSGFNRHRGTSGRTIILGTRVRRR